MLSDTKGGLEKYVALVSLVVEIILLVVAIIGSVLLYRELTLLRESNDLARTAFEASQRALLGVVGIDDLRLTDDGLARSASIRVENVGHSAATDIRTVGGFSYQDRPLPDNYEIKPEGKVVGSQSVLVPGAGFSLDRSVSGLTPQGLAKIRSGTLFLYLFGKLTYQDGLGKARETKYCAVHLADSDHWGYCPNNNLVE